MGCLVEKQSPVNSVIPRAGGAPDLDDTLSSISTTSQVNSQLNISKTSRTSRLSALHRSSGAILSTNPDSHSGSLSQSTMEGKGLPPNINTSINTNMLNEWLFSRDAADRKSPIPSPALAATDNDQGMESDGESHQPAIQVRRNSSNPPIFPTTSSLPPNPLQTPHGTSMFGVPSLTSRPSSCNSARPQTKREEWLYELETLELEFNRKAKTNSQSPGRNSPRSPRSPRNLLPPVSSSDATNST